MVTRCRDDLSREAENLSRIVMDLQVYVHNTCTCDQVLQTYTFFPFYFTSCHILFSGADALQNEKENLDKKVTEMDIDIKSLKKELQETKEQLKKSSEVHTPPQIMCHRVSSMTRYVSYVSCSHMTTRNESLMTHDDISIGHRESHGPRSSQNQSARDC